MSAQPSGVRQNLSASLGVSLLTHRADFVPMEPGSNVAALAASVRKRSGATIAKHDGAGLPTLVVYARFVAWSIEQQHFPMPELVMSRFNCCRATAHRWLNYLAEAYGVDRPKRDSSGNLRGNAEET
jgi:hypothetical protein